MNASRTASPWKAFRLIMLALALGTLGTTLASPLFPIYQQQWGLLPSAITVIYVAYIIGVLVAFLFLGRLADHVGSLKVLRAAIAIMLAGLIVSSVAPGAGWLIFARVLVGVASGLITTSATVGLTMFEPPGTRRIASLVASATTMVGFGLGPLLGGLLAQYLPWPLVLPYLVVAVVSVAIMVGLLRLKTAEHVKPAEPLSLYPRFILPAKPQRPTLFLASFATFSAFALFSLLASLAPSFLAEILPWHGPAVSGLAIAMVLLCSAGIQIPMRKVTSATGLRLGLCSLLASTILLAAAIAIRSPALFFAADLMIGLGHGMTFMASLGMVNGMAGKNDRAGILCTYFSIGYLGAVAPIVAVGWLADHLGLTSAVVVFSAAFAVFTALLLAVSRSVLATRPTPALHEQSA